MPTSTNDVVSTTTNNSVRRSSSQQSKIHDRHMKSDFLCRIKYANTIPDIPFDAKFLACPFVSINRFVDYKASGLEKNFKFELLTDSDLGIEIDLVNPDTYSVDADTKIQHHPTDLELLEDEQTNPHNIRRSQQHSKMVPWMRKTEYISSEFTRFGVSAERQETKVGYSTKRKYQDEILYRDRASQIGAINKTFTDVSKRVFEHPTKKGVFALAELPVLPDFENWMHPFALVTFDGDPIPKESKALSNELMGQALIRGMMDEEGEQFVAYFLPSKETIEKRAYDAKEGVEFDPDFIYEYNSIRDYNWTVKNKSSKGFELDNFVFSFRDDGVFYNELETRVALLRRKAKGVRQETILQVRNRTYDDSETATQQERLNGLLHPFDDKGEEVSAKDSSDNEENADSPGADVNEKREPNRDKTPINEEKSDEEMREAASSGDDIDEYERHQNGTTDSDESD